MSVVTVALSFLLLAFATLFLYQRTLGSKA